MTSVISSLTAACYEHGREGKAVCYLVDISGKNTCGEEIEEDCYAFTCIVL